MNLYGGESKERRRRRRRLRVKGVDGRWGWEGEVERRILLIGGGGRHDLMNGR